MTPSKDADGGDVEQYAIGAIRELRSAGVQGGYREAEASLEALDSMAWFDNFGIEVYHERMTAVYYIWSQYNTVADDHRELVEEAKDVTEARV